MTLRSRYVVLLIITELLILLSGCNGKEQVVVYCTVDRVFSEPVLKDFERETGIEVKAVFDTEETKSTGVLNRLIAEKDRPRCDVFWSGDPMRNSILKKKGITRAFIPDLAAQIPPEFKDPDGHWTGISARARVILYNKDLIPSGSLPQHMDEFTLPRFRGNFAIANPLFGTTTFHIAALYELWGIEKTDNWLKALKENGLHIAASNGDVKKLVLKARVAFGLTDTDDAFEAVKESAKTGFVFPGQGPDGEGTLIIPNAISLIGNAPHPQQAERLYNYLVSKETEQKLALSCAQMPLITGNTPPPGIPSLENIKPMPVDYGKLAGEFEKILDRIKKWTE